MLLQNIFPGYPSVDSGVPKSLPFKAVSVFLVLPDFEQSINEYTIRLGQLPISASLHSLSRIKIRQVLSIMSLTSTLRIAFRHRRTVERFKACS
jgi:hypothetical protein